MLKRNWAEEKEETAIMQSVNQCVRRTVRLPVVALLLCAMAGLMGAVRSANAQLAQDDPGQSDSAQYAPRTTVSIVDGRWHLNGQVTCPGARAEGLLLNVRMVNAVFEDARRHDFDAEANTQEFLEILPDYVAHGVRAFTLGLQGGFPGYQGALLND